MKHLHIGGSALLTGDEVADTVLELATALLRQREVEIAEFPFVDATGQLRRARIVLGGSQEIWAASTGVDGPELMAPADIDVMNTRVSALSRNGRPFVGFPDDSLLEDL